MGLGEDMVSIIWAYLGGTTTSIFMCIYTYGLGVILAVLRGFSGW